MRIISRKALREFWQRPNRHDAEQPLRAWFKEVSRADCSGPSDVKAAYRSASIVGNQRVVFNVAGNKYRLIVRVNYLFRVMYIRFIGTHREYDQVDASKV